MLTPQLRGAQSLVSSMYENNLMCHPKRTPQLKLQVQKARMICCHCQIINKERRGLEKRDKRTNSQKWQEECPGANWGWIYIFVKRILMIDSILQSTWLFVFPSLSFLDVSHLKNYLYPFHFIIYFLDLESHLVVLEGHCHICAQGCSGQVVRN